MKTKAYLLISILALLLSSCFVKSLHPFFKEKDVIFEQKLLGKWLDQDSGLWVINQFVRSKGFLNGDTVDNSYEMIFTEKDGSITKLNAHLFTLGGNRYLDFYPQIDGDNDVFISHIIPAHSLAKIEIGEQLVIKWFNEDWLSKLFEENRIKISHEKVNLYSSDKDSYILTASTDELQKFLLKYGNDENAFKRNWEGLEKDKNEDAFVYTLSRQH